MINRVIIMKKIKEKAFICIKLALLGAAVYFCVAETRLVREAVAEGADRCLTIVIPSLYAMMIVAVMIAKSGVFSCIPRLVKKLGNALFGMGGECLPVFAFSMFAGYPAGAKMITEQYSDGAISERSAAILCGVCFGAGPAFIMGCISGELYSSGLPGRLIIVSTVTANILIAFLASFFLRKSSIGENDAHRKICINGEMLTRSAVSAGRTMGELCFMITAFSVITAMLRHFGVISAAAGLFSRMTGFPPDISEAFIPAALDITAVRDLPANNYSLLPWLCALVSFGGVCVIMQISAIVSGKFPLRIFITLRLAAAALSFGICRLTMPFMLRNEIVAAATVNVSAHSSSSPVPSVMLLLMTFVVIDEYDKLVKISK